MEACGSHYYVMHSRASVRYDFASPFLANCKCSANSTHRRCHCASPEQMHAFTRCSWSSSPPFRGLRARAAAHLASVYLIDSGAGCVFAKLQRIQFAYRRVPLNESPLQAIYFQEYRSGEALRAAGGDKAEFALRECPATQLRPVSVGTEVTGSGAASVASRLGHPGKSLSRS